MTVDTSRVSAQPGLRRVPPVARSLSFGRLVALLALLAVSIGIGYYGYQRLAPAPPVVPNLVPVRSGTIAATLSATGTLISTRQARLTFSTSGRLTGFTVNLGDQVKAGDLLARTDSAQLENKLAQTQSSLRISQLNLEQLKAASTSDDTAAAQAAYDSAVAKLDELKKGPGAADLRTAESAIETAAANLETARANLDLLRAGSPQADVSAAEQAVASAQAQFIKAQSDYDTLENGPDPNEVLAAERSLEQAKNSLWATQIDRDATCGRGKGPGCDSANARVASSETGVAQAVDNLAQAQAGPKPEEVAAAQQTLDGAKAALAAAQAKLDLVRAGATPADIQAAQAAVASAQAAHESAVAALNDLKAGPKQSDLQAAEAQVASARATLNQKLGAAAAADIAVAEEQLEQAELAVDQAQSDLANASLVAPFDGVVAAISGNIGEAATNAFVTIVDPGALRVDVAVDETDVGKLKTGQVVNLTFDSHPDLQLTGTIDAVSPLGVTQQGVVTYPVTIELDQSPDNVQAGISATASVVIAQRDGVLLVPNRAVRTVGRNRLVSVSTDGKTEDRVVQVGLTNDQFTEIVSGLSEEEQVVIPTTTTRAPTVGGPGTNATFFAKPAAGGAVPAGAPR